MIINQKPGPLSFLTVAVMVFLISTGNLYGQGCIVARSSSNIGGPETEGGFQYARGRQLLTGTVGKAIRRDRTVSYPDSVYGSHGDAAFADYLWLASYSVRFGGRQHTTHHDMQDQSAKPGAANGSAHGASD
jgi:hypothetical protein